MPEEENGTISLRVTRVVGPYSYIDTHGYHENCIALLYLKRRGIPPTNCQAIGDESVRIWFMQPEEQEGKEDARHAA